MPISICSPKNMGKKLPNGPNDGLLLFFTVRTRKMGKNGTFSHFCKLLRLQNFLRGIRGCHMKADVLAIPKMWLFDIL